MNIEISLKSIGTIHTHFNDKEKMPIQPCGGMEHFGQIVISEPYIQGLKDLDGFTYIYLIYYFNQTKEEKLEVIPFNDKTDTPRGVFSTRTPVHPNKLGLSLVKLVSVKDNTIIYQGVDILDGTPIIDIKPFIPAFDHIEGEIKTGWMISNIDEIKQKKSDDRFKEYKV
jgi:tRNA-Thr(GGU) m(6)t(6)A37 methyltransferase TsaA